MTNGRFTEWLKTRDPEMIENDFFRSLASIAATGVGAAGGLAIGGPGGAIIGGLTAKELAAKYLPNRGLLKVDGTTEDKMKKKMKKRMKK